MVKYVDMTPTWSEIVPSMLAAPLSRQMREEFARMAQLADFWIGRQRLHAKDFARTAELVTLRAYKDNAGLLPPHDVLDAAAMALSRPQQAVLAKIEEQLQAERASPYAILLGEVPVSGPLLDLLNSVKEYLTA